MNVPPVGNPLLRAATLAAQKQREADSPERPAGPTGASTQVEEPQARPGRDREELERLADDVLAVFEESPERLEELVTTLRRLEAEETPSG